MGPALGRRVAQAAGTRALFLFHRCLLRGPWGLRCLGREWRICGNLIWKCHHTYPN